MPGLLQDILGNALMFAVAFYLAHATERRRLFFVRLPLCFIVFCGLRYLYFNVITEGKWGLWWQSLGFVVLLTLLAVSLFVCYKGNVWTSLFCASVSYGFQHIVQRGYLIFTRFLGGETTAHPVFWNVFIYVGLMLFAVAILIISMRYLKIKEISINNKYVLALSLVVILGNILWENWSFKAIHQGGDTAWLCARIAGIAIAVLTIILQFTLLSTRKTQLERDKLKQIVEDARKQYYFEKSLIDVINIKAHDLKHHYNAEEFSQSEKALVDAYDSTFKTENAALDVVLTKKAFVCKDKGIELTCMANGALLGFMEEGDVYSLFGNILDNAIEATESLSDKSKRVITLSVYKENGFIRIEESNYFSGELDFVGGLPKTTKSDKNFHGFGLRSIKMMVERYDGNVRIERSDDCFMLNVIIPISEK